MSAIWNKLEKRFGKDAGLAKEKAESFLASHPKENLYPVTFEDGEANLEMTCLVQLSDSDYAKLSALAKDYDAPWEEFPELTQRLVEEESPMVNPQNCWEVKEVGLNPEHSYLFTIASFKGGNKRQLELIPCHISLSDEEYTAILAWKLLHIQAGEGSFSFNMMRIDLPDLFGKISTMLEISYGYNLYQTPDVPYAVFMDEVDKDVKQIAKNK